MRDQVFTLLREAGRSGRSYFAKVPGAILRRDFSLVWIGGLLRVPVNWHLDLKSKPNRKEIDYPMIASHCNAVTVIGSQTECKFMESTEYHSVLVFPRQ